MNALDDASVGAFTHDRLICAAAVQVLPTRKSVGDFDWPKS
jgi:hypothetical protein